MGEWRVFLLNSVASQRDQQQEKRTHYGRNHETQKTREKNEFK